MAIPDGRWAESPASMIRIPLFNANKKSLTINLKDPKGLALVKDLAKKADVVIENFAPGAIERLGLGADVVRALNPAVIYCQVKGFGEGSPLREKPGVRHDRWRRHDVDHRRARRQAVEAWPVAGRHRHGHVAGCVDPGRAVPPVAHRQG